MREGGRGGESPKSTKYIFSVMHIMQTICRGHYLEMSLLALTYLHIPILQGDYREGVKKIEFLENISPITDGSGGGANPPVREADFFGQNVKNIQQYFY